jgi:hypothetical protein
MFVLFIAAWHWPCNPDSYRNCTRFFAAIWLRITGNYREACSADSFEQSLRRKECCMSRPKITLSPDHSIKGFYINRI